MCQQRHIPVNSSPRGCVRWLCATVPNATAYACAQVPAEYNGFVYVCDGAGKVSGTKASREQVGTMTASSLSQALLVHHLGANVAPVSSCLHGLLHGTECQYCMSGSMMLKVVLPDCFY